VQVRDPAKVAWLSQTTLSVDETMRTVDALRTRFPLLTSPPSDDICYATQNRQVSVKAIAGQCDLVLVIGSRNSSNSVRLVEVALDGGAGASYLIDDASEIDASWLHDVSVIGVTSGASAPDSLVRAVLDRLAAAGWDDVETVSTAEETTTFSLPKELRAAEKASGLAPGPRTTADRA
jgi:4-hydroxy-3-methylbut-2-enyl diphosphate reductase